MLEYNFKYVSIHPFVILSNWITHSLNILPSAYTLSQLLTHMVQVKWSRYRPGMAQRVGRGIALLFHDRDTRRGWVVSTPRPHFTPGKDPVPILQEAGWAPGPVWMGGKSRPHRDSIPDRPARSQSLYRLRYPAHTNTYVKLINNITNSIILTDIPTSSDWPWLGVYLPLARLSCVLPHLSLLDWDCPWVFLIAWPAEALADEEPHTKWG